MNLSQFMQPNFSFSCTLFIIFFRFLMKFFIPRGSILREIFHLTQKHTKKRIFIITAFPSHLSFLVNEIKFINRTCNHKKVFIFLTHSFSLPRACLMIRFSEKLICIHCARHLNLLFFTHYKL